jgi:23S rRNA pseudouridine2605 synthase
MKDPRNPDEVSQPTIPQLDLIDREPHAPPFRDRFGSIIPQTRERENRAGCTRRANELFLVPMKEQREPSDDGKKLVHWIQQHGGISRRKAQELIARGEVAVDGVTVTEPSAPVAGEDVRTLSLRGHPLPIEAPEPRVYRYHKGRGILCSHDDPHEGNTVGRILRAEGFIGYTWAGRLDRDAEGLLVLSNEGDLIHAFTHPRYEVEKTYRVWTDPAFEPSAASRIFAGMRAGIADDGDTLRILEGRARGRPPCAEVTLTEGQKHEVKRLFAHFGFRVRRLVRVRVGPIDLGNLPRGSFSRLSPAEEAAAFAFARERLAGR